MRIGLGKWMVAVVLAVLAIGMVATTGVADDNGTGHYINGVEGIKGASLPPPGLYLRLYNLFYTADKLTDGKGDEIKALPTPGGPLPVDLDLSVFAVVPRLIWISGMTVLGGSVGADMLVPLVYTDVELAPVMKDDKFAVGDLYVEPLVLAWHGARWDAAVGISAYIPTGDYSQSEPASPGKDFWTTMLTVGGTLYLDAAKTWSASLLTRYETHSEKDELDWTLGDDFHFEWALGKTIARTWDVGVAGYCQWQVTEDEGTQAAGDLTVKDQVFAVGPEVSVFLPPAGLFVSLRSEWEFGAEDRTEGIVTALTLTKIL